MKIKRLMFCIIALLSITVFASCESPPKISPAEKIDAKAAWDIISPTMKTLNDDAVPVYIVGQSMKPDYPAEGGKTPRWDVGFYSESEKAIWVIGYYAPANGEATPNPGEKRYSDVSLVVSSLEDWNIDSPEACDIAAKNGAIGTDFMRLQTAELDTMDKAPIFRTPDFIPESTNLFWVIRDEKWNMYYIDASTGEYLGSCTLENLNK